MATPPTTTTTTTTTQPSLTLFITAPSSPTESRQLQDNLDRHRLTVPMMTAVADSDWSQPPWDNLQLPIGEYDGWNNNHVEDALTDLDLGLHPGYAVPPPAKRRKVSITPPPPPQSQPLLPPQPQQQQEQQQPAASANIGIAALTLPKSRKPAAGSMANNARKSTKKTKPISSHIPFEIWLEIFSHCPPSQLAKLRRVNSSFKAFIDDEKLWAKSRQNTFPSHPEPMYNFPEHCMWNLWKGSGCEICGAPRFKKCYWTWGIRLCTNCFKENRVRGDGIVGEREFVNAALVCLRHCFVSGKFVSTQRGNYYGLGGGDPCYWRDEVTAFRAAYNEKKEEDLAHPGTLATFLELEKDIVRVKMETAVKMCEFERQDRSHVLMLHTEATARREELAEIRRQRLISIPEKCKQYFDPAIPEGVLELIPSYQTALKAGSVLTDRGWKTLVTKITSERAKAEEEYKRFQQDKESAHFLYLKIRRKARSDELREYHNLLKLRSAMGELVKLAREFIKKEGGFLILDHSRAQSFVLETMKFCRRRWYEKNEGQTLPFRSLYFLWEEVLEGQIGIFKEAEFCCEYCSERGTWEEIVFHLASEHHKEPGMVRLARNPMEFAEDEKVIYKRPIPNWDGVDWPEKLPVLSTGPKFTPRTLKDKAPRPSPSTCSSTNTASNKPRKPRKPGTSREDPICMFSSSLSVKFQKPHTTPRILITRLIVEVSELLVPQFFQLSLFFRKLVAEFRRYKLRVEFNELLYEFIRICDKTPPWFTHDALICNTCLHTWDGAENIVTLMIHFFQSHHPKYDWRKDMLLMPAAPDILTMLHNVNDRGTEYHWNQAASEHGLDGVSARDKQLLAEQHGEVLCLVEELKSVQVKRGVEGVYEGMDKRVEQAILKGEMGPVGYDRKRKRDGGEDGKGKGKEMEGASYDELYASDAEEEDWPHTFDVEGDLSDDTVDHCDMPEWCRVDAEMEE